MVCPKYSSQNLFSDKNYVYDNDGLGDRYGDVEGWPGCDMTSTGDWRERSWRNLGEPIPVMDIPDHIYNLDSHWLFSRSGLVETQSGSGRVRKWSESQMVQPGWVTGGRGRGWASRVGWRMVRVTGAQMTAHTSPVKVKPSSLGLCLPVNTIILSNPKLKEQSQVSKISNVFWYLFAFLQFGRASVWQTGSHWLTLCQNLKKKRKTVVCCTGWHLKSACSRWCTICWVPCFP